MGAGQSTIEVEVTSEEQQQPEEVAANTTEDPGGGAEIENEETGGSDVTQIKFVTPKIKDREEALGKTIQHLAEENMKLAEAKNQAVLELGYQKSERNLERFAHQEEIARFHSQLEEKALEMDGLRERIEQEENEKERLYASKEAIRDELRAEREIKDRAIEELQRLRLELHRLNKEKDEKAEADTEAAAAELPELSPRPSDDDTARAEAREAEMARFRAALGSRREMRHKAISAVSTELARLRAELTKERELREAAEQALANAAHQAPLEKLLLDVASGGDETPVESTANTGSEEGCYKSVDTPSGPRQVISVSKTFIRLKDLILEKKSLQKELGRLKELNGRLEKQLSSQEHRLSLVSSELHKTWAVVARMKQQHRQLHTHEKILRYELQHKRKMLNELKQELEYCREKWQRARVKNSQSEAEWRQLRGEFAARRQHLDSANNSAESGFSDDNEPSPSNQPSSPVEETSIPGEESNLPEEPPHEDVLKEESWQDTTQLDCPASVSLLKEQLCFFAENLDAINTELRSTTAKEALDSIFSLPPIVMPNRYFRTLEALDRCKARSAEDLRESTRTPPPSKLEENNINETKKDDRLEDKESDNYIEKEEEIVRLEGTRENKLEEKENRLEEEEREKENRLEEKEKDVIKEEKTKSQEEKEDGSDAKKTESRLDEPKDKEEISLNLDVRPHRDTRTPEEVLAARSARLKRLEEQCQQLFNKVTRTTHRSHALANRLDDLHEYYGPEASTSSTNSSANLTTTAPAPPPPPMPDQLPVFKIPESPQPQADNDAKDESKE